MSNAVIVPRYKRRKTLGPSIPQADKTPRENAGDVNNGIYPVPFISRALVDGAVGTTKDITGWEKFADFTDNPEGQVFVRGGHYQKQHDIRSTLLLADVTLIVGQVFPEYIQRVDKFNRQKPLIRGESNSGQGRMIKISKGSAGAKVSLEQHVGTIVRTAADTGDTIREKEDQFELSKMESITEVISETIQQMPYLCKKGTVGLNTKDDDFKKNLHSLEVSRKISNMTGFLHSESAAAMSYLKDLSNPNPSEPCLVPSHFIGEPIVATTCCTSVGDSNVNCTVRIGDLHKRDGSIDIVSEATKTVKTNHLMHGLPLHIDAQMQSTGRQAYDKLFTTEPRTQTRNMLVACNANVGPSYVSLWTGDRFTINVQAPGVYLLEVECKIPSLVCAYEGGRYADLMLSHTICLQNPEVGSVQNDTRKVMMGCDVVCEKNAINVGNFLPIPVRILGDPQFLRTENAYDGHFHLFNHDKKDSVKRIIGGAAGAIPEVTISFEVITDASVSPPTTAVKTVDIREKSFTDHVELQGTVTIPIVTTNSGICPAQSQMRNANTMAYSQFALLNRINP